MRILLLGCVALIATGCANQNNLYDWGSYEDNLFNYYHKPEAKEKVIANHLEFLAKLERQNKRPAPGLLAEAGTLLLLEGDTEKAVEYYQKEHDTWPESRDMMSKLIANLKERQ